MPRPFSEPPGFVRTELADSIDNPEVREQIRRSRDEFAISPDAVARAIAFAVEQPYDVEIGDITIRPASKASHRLANEDHGGLRVAVCGREDQVWGRRHRS